MKIILLLLVLPFYTFSHAWWLVGKTCLYENWHRGQLTLWLDCHNVPYDENAGSKDLENLIKLTWNSVSKLKCNYQNIEKSNEWLINYVIEMEKEANVNKDRVSNKFNTLTKPIYTFWDKIRIHPLKRYHFFENSTGFLNSSYINPLKPYYTRDTFLSMLSYVQQQILGITRSLF